jgi:hypothetical protein
LRVPGRNPRSNHSVWHRIGVLYLAVLLCLSRSVSPSTLLAGPGRPQSMLMKPVMFSCTLVMHHTT